MQVGRESNVSSAAHQDSVQRDARTRIEAVVNADAGLPTKTVEGFPSHIPPLAKFMVSITITAARDADSQICVRAERLADSQFGIEISRPDGEPKGQVRATQK